MPRYCLDFAYCGTHFSGYAKQIGLHTVQAQLELGLSKVLPNRWKTDVSVVVAARTDAGVHAKHQVVHFDDETADLDLCVTLRRLNRVLPDDITAYKLVRVPDDFSARFWASERTYKYRICDSPYPNPLRTVDVHNTFRKLDVTKMNKAVYGFTGVHDFAAFVKFRRGATTIRNLKYFKFKRVRYGKDRGLIVATLTADAFAYNMVRSLVGAAIFVGLEKRPINWMRQCLDAKVRCGATGATNPSGLTLERVKYVSSPKRARCRMKKIRARRKNSYENT
ncbi:MAG: tRNA pseudouridine(38-40) synthase TruA [Candidatus Ancillula trichonymphae]|jgi:tRNA pseudouridine38-40 synthase|nr:tRNA pseudouridine(38-40) synthase TruA [Candidatus Ancillula trichonymphae]